MDRFCSLGLVCTCHLGLPCCSFELCAWLLFNETASKLRGDVLVPIPWVGLMILEKPRILPRSKCSAPEASASPFS